MISIVDYGMGNLRSVANAFEAIGQDARITHDPSPLKDASAIVLPGVGAFGDGMRNLQGNKLVEALHEQVMVRKKPYLGICLGLQFLAKKSFEHGCHEGLGWINGVVRKISPDEKRFKVPIMGWNDVQIAKRDPLFLDMEDRPVFYFVHSYCLEVEDDSSGIITSTCWHGTTITTSVQHENIFAVQFHPEKSQRAGLRLLENFVRLI